MGRQSIAELSTLRSSIFTSYMCYICKLARTNRSGLAISVCAKGPRAQGYGRRYANIAKSCSRRISTIAAHSTHLYDNFFLCRLAIWQFEYPAAHWLERALELVYILFSRLLRKQIAFRVCEFHRDDKLLLANKRCPTR